MVAPGFFDAQERVDGVRNVDRPVGDLDQLGCFLNRGLRTPVPNSSTTRRLRPAATTRVGLRNSERSLRGQERHADAVTYPAYAVQANDRGKLVGA